jgi:hypothetical protein
MNARKIILFIVIAIGFGGSIYLLRGVFSKPGTTPVDLAQLVQVDTSGGTGTGQHILPFGSNLDFTQIKKYNPETRLYPYPEVTTSEIGLSLSEFIKPAQ